MTPAVSSSHWYLPSNSHGSVWLQARPGRDGGSSQSCVFSCRPTQTLSTSQQKGLKKPGRAQGFVLLFMHHDHLFPSLPALLSLLQTTARAHCWPRYRGHTTDPSSSLADPAMLLWDRPGLLPVPGSQPHLLAALALAAMEIRKAPREI